MCTLRVATRGLLFDDFDIAEEQIHFSIPRFTTGLFVETYAITLRSQGLPFY